MRKDKSSVAMTTIAILLFLSMGIENSVVGIIAGVVAIAALFYLWKEHHD